MDFLVSSGWSTYYGSGALSTVADGTAWLFHNPGVGSMSTSSATVTFQSTAQSGVSLAGFLGDLGGDGVDEVFFGGQSRDDGLDPGVMILAGGGF